MNKEDLLKQIAETAYDVGFGAKKHFASYDMIEKIPFIINFIAITVGIFALIFDELTIRPLSATLIILGIIGMCISAYDANKNDFNLKGIKLTDIFQELKILYFIVKANNNNNLQESVVKLEKLKSDFYSNTISKQVLLSDWYAHYKFFWQHQIDWINDELNFKFWRDKIPLSLTLLIILIISLTIYLEFIK
jgi:hypothetical protein